MGAFGHMFVNHDLRRSGLGIVVADMMQKKLALRNEPSVGFIHKANPASLKTALKLGSCIANDDYQILINIRPKL